MKANGEEKMTVLKLLSQVQSQVQLHLHYVSEKGLHVVYLIVQKIRSILPALLFYIRDLIC